MTFVFSSSSLLIDGDTGGLDAMVESDIVTDEKCLETTPCRLCCCCCGGDRRVVELRVCWPLADVLLVFAYRAPWVFDDDAEGAVTEVAAVVCCHKGARP